jgi:hypothetical protein
MSFLRKCTKNERKDIETTDNGQRERKDIDTSDYGQRVKEKA